MLKEIFILVGNSAGVISLIAILIFWLKFRQYEKKVDLLWKVLNPSPDKKITKLEIVTDEYGPHFAIEYDNMNLEEAN